jgi:2-keto-3-deoxy-L-rhamnonate aldolase RhmA
MSTWPTTLEVIGETDLFHYVEFTSTYAPYDLYALENLGRAAELHNMTAMIKIDAEPKHYLAQRAIGSGFQSILFADLRTVQQVEEAIRSVRAEPKGWNGCSMERIEGMTEGGTRNFVKYCDDVVINVMIEKRPLYEHLEDVLNLEGVDMVQFGPCDFSMSMEIWGEYDKPAIKQADEKIIKMALKYDKHPRIELGGPIEVFQKEISRYIKLGVQDFCIGTDLDILFQWMKTFGGAATDALSTVRAPTIRKSRSGK